MSPRWGLICGLMSMSIDMPPLWGWRIEAERCYKHAAPLGLGNREPDAAIDMLKKYPRK